MATSPSITCPEKKHWWLTNRKIVDKYVTEARILISSRDHCEISTALGLAEAALTLSPRLEPALELKARSLLYLRRYREVADMLQDYIPSLKMAADEPSGGSLSSESSLSKERVKLLGEEGEERDSFKCFSVPDLMKKFMAGLRKSCDKEGEWRYLILGQACCHLGLLEDAVLLLQTGKRLAAAALRRQSTFLSSDSFSTTTTTTDLDQITRLLSTTKLLLRRKMAAISAALPSESLRHLTKLLSPRRPSPRPFLADCFLHRAVASKSLHCVADAIADCNRTLALEPSSIHALSLRSSLFESLRCLPDSLHDLEHLKLLYNSILRERKLPGPAWRKQNLSTKEIPIKLSALNTKITEMKKRMSSGENVNIDYYALFGVRRGCSRSDIERAHLLLILKHKPDKSLNFIEKCEFGEDCDVDSVRDSAKMSSLMLYRLIQKGYASLARAVVEEQTAAKAAAALQAAVIQVQQQQQSCEQKVKLEIENNKNRAENNKVNCGTSNSGSVFQGVFCRDISAVGSLLSQVGFNRPITVKYEALSC